MAYTDFTGKSIINSWGNVQITLAETVLAGDLITQTGYLADAEDTKPAAYVAIQGGDSGDIIWAALTAVVKKPAEIATGGAATRGDHGSTLGTVLYLAGSAAQGQASESAGTLAQKVGWALSQDELLFSVGSVVTDLGITATVAELNILDGCTATYAELNLLDLVGLTTGEVLRATGAAAASWGSTGVKLSAPDISGVVTAAAALTLPTFTAGGAITEGKFGTSVITANAAGRGKFYLTEGASGTTDKLYLIMKSAADTYSAVQAAVGG